MENNYKPLFELSKMTQGNVPPTPFYSFVYLCEYMTAYLTLETFINASYLTLRKTDGGGGAKFLFYTNLTMSTCFVTC